jgi:uncharacterized protein YndB with AHSA1/START domain
VSSSKASVTVTIKAPVTQVFNFVAEPSNTPRFMRGITRYDPVGKKRTGKGAAYSSTAVIAGRDFDVELEVTAWDDDERIVAVSRKGPKTRGTWTFEEFDDGTTDATLVYEYELPMVFKLVPGVNGMIERDLAKSLEQLRKLIEMEAKKPAGRRKTAKK